MITMYIRRIILPTKGVVSLFDLGFLGVEDDYPEHKSPLPSRRKRLPNLPYGKKNTTEIIPGEDSDRT